MYAYFCGGCISRVAEEETRGRSINTPPSPIVNPSPGHRKITRLMSKFRRRIRYKVQVAPPWFIALVALVTLLLWWNSQ
jgi:hypothetical protein